MSDKFKALVRMVQRELEQDPTLERPAYMWVREQVEATMAAAESADRGGDASSAGGKSGASIVTTLVSLIKPKARRVK